MRKKVLNRKVNEKGITLIALVITIIVLLILAGVTIATLTGDNGILTKAKEAKEKNELATEDEQRKMAMLEAATNTENTEYTDPKTNETITIPAGFAPTRIAGESTIDEGLVITDSYGNEFVWIPVPNAIWNKAQHETISSLDYTPMSAEIGGNYRGILYKLDGTVTAFDYENNDYNNPNWIREPGFLNIGDSDTKEENLKKAGITGGLEEFKTQVQNDYNEVAVSVEKYHGFYVARYEMSYENGKAQYKKGKNSWVNYTDEKDTWYGYYKKQREFANDYGYENNVKSSMIWGSQYDAIMNWMERKGINILDDNLDFNTSRITGSKEEDKISNIYDLVGNSYEWTLEAITQEGRTRRGGSYATLQAIAKRSGIGPRNMGDGAGSRMTLCIK